MGVLSRSRQLASSLASMYSPHVVEQITKVGGRVAVVVLGLAASDYLVIR